MSRGRLGSPNSASFAVVCGRRDGALRSSSSSCIVSSRRGWGVGSFYDTVKFGDALLEMFHISGHNGSGRLRHSFQKRVSHTL